MFPGFWSRVTQLYVVQLLLTLVWRGPSRLVFFGNSYIPSRLSLQVREKKFFIFIFLTLLPFVKLRLTEDKRTRVRQIQLTLGERSLGNTLGERSLGKWRENLKLWCERVSHLKIANLQIFDYRSPITQE